VAGAVLLEGPVADVVRVVPHLRRSRREPTVLPFVVMDGLVAAVQPSDLDPRVRLATHRDMGALIELYREFELTPIPTVPRLRRFLRDRVDRGLMGVLEERGRVLAAGYGAARTDEFVILTGLTARPETRGRGLGAALLPLAAYQAREAGVRLAAVWAPTNAIRLKPERVAKWTGGQALAGWCQARLTPPRSRFRGERRLHALVERLEGRVDRRPQVLVENQVPGSPTTG
jgi:N-acetylglutamate synthase-like GNAT family acetyltransferase